MNTFEKASADMLANLMKLDSRCKELHRDNEALRARLAAAEKTVHDISGKAIDQGDKLYRENEALRTRLAAADSLIAELKRREADRLSGPTPLGKTERALAETRELLSKCEVKYTVACRERNAIKSAHAELAQERDQLRVDLEKVRVSHAVYKKTLERFYARYDEFRNDILHAYTAVFGTPKPELTHKFYRAAVARLAKYAKAGYRLNNAMAEVETATKQYESLARGPHSFTVDIVAELTERADRRAADDEARRSHEMMMPDEMMAPYGSRD